LTLSSGAGGTAGSYTATKVIKTCCIFKMLLCSRLNPIKHLALHSERPHCQGQGRCRRTQRPVDKKQGTSPRSAGYSIGWDTALMAGTLPKPDCCRHSTAGQRGSSLQEHEAQMVTSGGDNSIKYTQSTEFEGTLNITYRASGHLEPEGVSMSLQRDSPGAGWLQSSPATAETGQTQTSYIYLFRWAPVGPRRCAKARYSIAISPRLQNSRCCASSTDALLSVLERQSCT
jgi:hypothetical protein